MNKLIATAFCLLTISLLVFSCKDRNPNVDKAGVDELKALELGHALNLEDQNFQDIIYVPIYSDVYVDQQNQKSLLAATLSIRNTSLNDSLFISRIDYFDTGGNLVRSYLENPISLPPMGTINYVVEKEDDTGGPGANFIVGLSAKNKKVRPLVQAVMIGQSGNKGFAFSTDGYSINKKE